jgi:hypothetical protein
LHFRRTYVKLNFIARKEDEAYLDTVARAITSPMTTGAYDGSQSGNPANDYHRLDISQVMLLVANENVPLSVRFSRREAVRALKHFWYEQYLPGTGAITFVSELNDPSDQIANVPTRFENVMGKLGRVFKMSDEAQIIARANGLEAVGTDELARQMEMQIRLLIRDQERGILQASYDDGSGANPRAFRSLLGDYRAAVPVKNGWIGDKAQGAPINPTDTPGLIINLNGEELVAKGATGTQHNIADVLNQWMYNQYMLFAGPMPNVAYVPPRLLKPFADAASEKIQITMTQDELARRAVYNLGGAAGKFYSDFGIIDIVAHPLLTASDDAAGVGENRPALSRILFLHEPSVSLLDYVGYGGVHIEPRAKTGPTETRVISEILTMEMRNLKSHGVIENFWYAAAA